ncbi:membrane protein [Kutzneria sp. 744]|nr:membrane protein [Kutzneria sp. 744]
MAYLPNAIVAALSFAMGPGFTMGTFSVTPLHLAIAKLPAVPLFAAVPANQSRTLLGLMIAPLVVGLFLGWTCRRIAPRPLARLRGVAVAAAVVGGTAFLLAALTGGRLGGGVFSPVTVPAGLVGAVALGWVLIPAGLVAFFTGPKQARNVRPVPVAVEPEPVAEAETVIEADDAEAEDIEADDLEGDVDLDEEDVEDEDFEDEPESYEYDPGEEDQEEDELDYEELDEAEEEAEFEDDVMAELEAEADAELAAEDEAAESTVDEADGDEDHSTARPDDK